MANLLAVPAVRLPTLYHHRHLSFMGEYGIWDGLETFNSQTNPEYIVTMSCPGDRPQLRYIFNTAVGAEECGQDFACKECRDIKNYDLDSPSAHVFWLEPEEFCHNVAS